VPLFADVVSERRLLPSGVTAPGLPFDEVLGDEANGRVRRLEATRGVETRSANMSIVRLFACTASGAFAATSPAQLVPEAPGKSVSPRSLRLAPIWSKKSLLLSERSDHSICRRNKPGVGLAHARDDQPIDKHTM
jgi:hypothetical protein